MMPNTARRPNVYGNVIKCSDGALSDPAVRKLVEEQLRANFDETVVALGRPLYDFTVMTQPHREAWPPSEDDMRMWGWPEDEIAETLAWQAEQEWPMYADYLAWRAHD